MSTPDYNQGYNDGKIGISGVGGYSYEQGRRAAVAAQQAAHSNPFTAPVSNSFSNNRSTYPVSDTRIKFNPASVRAFFRGALFGACANLLLTFLTHFRINNPNVFGILNYFNIWLFMDALWFAGLFCAVSQAKRRHWILALFTFFLCGFLTGWRPVYQLLFLFRSF